MKVFLVLAALLAAVSALPIEERINGENGWYIPRVDGTSEWMDREQAEQLLSSATLERASDDVSFYVYTKSNPTDGKKIDMSASSIRDSHFNKDHPTRFVIHGWGGKWSDSYNTRITKAWLSRGNYNVIVVGWEGAQSINYVSSVNAVPPAGHKVGEMIKYLHQSHGMSLDTLYVIGHSLGAQVSGYAGKTVGEGKIHTIIGLDPALPLFSYDQPDKRLAAGDAYYVESIQTNGGMKGFLKPIGRGAFYPNGGKKQPGCGTDPQGTCSHGRSVTYYIEAVTQDNFGTIKCRDYEDAVAKDCGSTYSSVRMGADINSYMASGDFYVPVNSETPFGNMK